MILTYCRELETDQNKYFFKVCAGLLIFFQDSPWSSYDGYASYGPCAGWHTVWAQFYLQQESMCATAFQSSLKLPLQ